MDDPMKIIHKYKNNNKRIQYNIYIFLGDIIDETCMRVLKKIKDMDMYTALISLDERERNIIEKNYGAYWYEKFYNSYHISNTKETVSKNPSKLKELKTFYDNKWVTEHFINYKTRLETITYNYESMVKEERERKNVKKLMQKQQYEAEDIIDYTTSGKSKIPIGLSGNENLPADENLSGDINLSGNDNLARLLSNKYNQENMQEDDWCQESSSSDDGFGSSSDDSIFSSGSESDQEEIDIDSDDFESMMTVTRLDFARSATRLLAGL